MKYLILFFCTFFISNTGFSKNKNLVTADCVIPENSLSSTDQRIYLHKLEKGWNDKWFIFANDNFFNLDSDPSERFSLLFQQTEEVTMSNDYSIYSAFTSPGIIEKMAKAVGIHSLKEIERMSEIKAVLDTNNNVELILVYFTLVNGQERVGVYFENLIIACTQP